MRLELSVRKDDVPLVRALAKALIDPRQESEARTLLRQRFAGDLAKGFKAYLESAPLDGIDLTRIRDSGRDFAL